jgi:uncharacterized repeat protein (TIGR03847 family)
MAHFSEDDAHPVTRITAGSVGEPGSRVFILQAQYGKSLLSWVIEKDHAVALTRAIPRLLSEIRSQYPELAEPLVAHRPNLVLVEPLSPEFRVTSIGLGYDRIHDLVVLTLADDGQDSEDDQVSPDGTPASSETQLFTTRGQAQLLSQQSEQVVTAGRPACPNCGQPIDGRGHFCAPDAARRRTGGVFH